MLQRLNKTVGHSRMQRDSGVYQLLHTSTQHPNSHLILECLLSTILIMCMFPPRDHWLCCFVLRGALQRTSLPQQENNVWATEEEATFNRSLICCANQTFAEYDCISLKQNREKSTFFSNMMNTATATPPSPNVLALPLSTLISWFIS